MLDEGNSNAFVIVLLLYTFFDFAVFLKKGGRETLPDDPNNN